MLDTHRFALHPSMLTSQARIAPPPLTTSFGFRANTFPIRTAGSSTSTVGSSNDCTTFSSIAEKRIVDTQI